MDRQEIARLRGQRVTRRATRHKRTVSRALARARFVMTVGVLVFMIVVLVLGVAGLL